ncbi:SURF1 family protein [uncultured Umboniibacter sp.]|uniref:SURF1 family protein n=1 Tax=uncultured Umboniibacter sp. TaxID=1798917 RepID=UPI0026177E52|nr:SURF1 family protein [uncultured Umboniibacter sp.]
MLSQNPATIRRLHWSFHVLCLALLILLINLGFWQLQRADWRAEQWQALEQQLQQPAARLAQMDSYPVHRLVETQGQWLNEEALLLQNRTYDGQAGVEVLVPFRTNEGLVLVNRGFVGWNYGASLPAISAAKNSKVLGRIAPVDQNPVLNQRVDTASTLVQTRDLKVLSDRLGAPIITEIRLVAEHPDALATNWQFNRIGPEKHLGYAVQWFCMSFALLILWIVVFIRSKKNNNNGEVHADVR